MYVRQYIHILAQYQNHSGIRRASILLYIPNLTEITFSFRRTFQLISLNCRKIIKSNGFVERIFERKNYSVREKAPFVLYPNECPVLIPSIEISFLLFFFVIFFTQNSEKGEI